LRGNAELHRQLYGDPEGTTPPPGYGVSPDKTGTHAFPALDAGYPEVTPLTVTVTNTGNAATGALAAALGGSGAGSFTLSGVPIADIPASGSASFSVGPKTGLAAGSYTATVSVGGGNGISMVNPVLTSDSCSCRIACLDEVYFFNEAMRPLDILSMILYKETDVTIYSIA
jgi:hypothetical protein